MKKARQDKQLIPDERLGGLINSLKRGVLLQLKSDGLITEQQLYKLISRQKQDDKPDER